MSRQGRVAVLEVEQHPAWVSCVLAWGRLPTVTPKHQSHIPQESDTQDHKDRSRAGCLSHRGDLREIRKPVLARDPHSQSRVTTCNCPAATSRTSHPLPDYHLPSPTNGRGTGTPQTGQPTLQGRCLDISPRGPPRGLSGGRQKPGAVFVPEGSQLFEAKGHGVLGPSLSAHHLGP